MDDTRFVTPGGRSKLFCLIAELDGEVSWIAWRQRMTGRIEQAGDNSRTWSAERNLGEADGKARSITDFIVDTQTAKSHRAGEKDRSGLAIINLLPLPIDRRRQNFLLDAHTAKRGWESRPFSA